MQSMIWSYYLNLSYHMWAPVPDDAKNETDVALWDEMVDFIAERGYNMVVIDIGDGIKFESHPEISAPDAWDKDFLKKKLDEMRAKGIEPIPKLNFSACHCVWMKQYRYMISTPTYYQVCADLIAEVCEAFGYPRLFHLGLDEEVIAHQRAQHIAIIRQGEHWWHDAFFLFRECEKHGARPWVWSDYYWHNPELFVKNMPKSVLQSNWYYGRFDKKDASGNRVIDISTYVDFERLGYDQVPTASTWSKPKGHNQLETLEFCREHISPERLKGFMTVPWSCTQRDYEFFLKNDAHMFFVARKTCYPETLK